VQHEGTQDEHDVQQTEHDAVWRVTGVGVRGAK
jgi:hypothetical protein